MDTDNRYGLLETQEYYLPIMDHIDMICRKHGIKYTLSDGTLIGAVRHGGFIPWDDDIDISFDRSNYRKFMSALKKDLAPEYMVVRDLWVRRITRRDNPDKYSDPPERCIDLFVFDKVPDGRIQNGLKNLTVKILQGMLKRELTLTGLPLWQKAALSVTHFMGAFFSRKRKQRWFDRVSQAGRGTKKLARYCCSYRYISGIRYPSDMINEYTNVEFEGRKYMALKDWDTFLSTDYGDYM